MRLCKGNVCKYCVVKLVIYLCSGFVEEVPSVMNGKRYKVKIRNKDWDPILPEMSLCALSGAFRPHYHPQCFTNKGALGLCRASYSENSLNSYAFLSKCKGIAVNVQRIGCIHCGLWYKEQCNVKNLDLMLGLTAAHLLFYCSSLLPLCCGLLQPASCSWAG